MKILGICGSPRKGGNTEILLREVLTSAAQAGAETELFTVYDKDIKPCDGCRLCRKKGACHIQDDMQPLYTKLLAADGIVFGSPVYFWSVTGQAKIILDRLNFYYYLGKLSNKVAAGIAVAGAQGHTEVRSLLYSFFAQNHMIIADFVSGFGSEKGHVRRDRHAMAAASLMGKKMVAVIAQALRYPEGYQIPVTTFVREKLRIPSSPAEGRCVIPSPETEMASPARPL